MSSMFTSKSDPHWFSIRGETILSDRSVDRWLVFSCDPTWSMTPFEFVQTFFDDTKCEHLDTFLSIISLTHRYAHAYNPFTCTIRTLNKEFIQSTLMYQSLFSLALEHNKDIPSIIKEKYTSKPSSLAHLVPAEKNVVLFKIKPIVFIPRSSKRHDW